MAVQATDITLLSSAARIATTHSAEFEWLDAKAFMVFNVTAVTATPSLWPSLEVYDTTSGSWVTMWTEAGTTAPHLPTGAATYLYIFTDTGFTPTGGAITESKQVYLSKRMRLKVLHADADSATYSVGLNRVNSNNLGI